MSCPLCLSEKIGNYFDEPARKYLKCAECELVFVPAEYHLPPLKEKMRYDLHKNTPDNEGYTAFLGRLVREVVKRAKPGEAGLDFGSGPVPVLSMLLQRAGFKMSIYDLFYSDNPAVLDEKYDFVTCSETIEHVFAAAKVWKTLLRCAGESGFLAVMTKRIEKGADFARWHYKNDETHLCYYSDATFSWVASSYNCELEFVGPDIAILASKEI